MSEEMIQGNISEVLANVQSPNNEDGFMTRRDIFHGAIGAAVFALIYWLFWSYTFSDASWPFTSVVWADETPFGYGGVWRFWLALVAMIGTLVSFFIGSAYDNWGGNGDETIR